jgi:hypothetical protein
MSELAFNINGEAFEVPAHATGWRVRRMRMKGSPEVVYSRDGIPLVLPIDAELEDLRHEVEGPGRYRLDLVDQNNKAIQDVSSAYVHVNTPQPAAPAPVATALPFALPASLTQPSDNIIIEAMRLNAAVANSVVGRFPEMMQSASILMRAVDVTGLAMRAFSGAAPEADDDDDDEEESQTPNGFDLNALAAQLIPVIMSSFLSGKVKLPGLGSVFDWRKAANSGAAKKSAEKTEPAAPAATLPLDAAAMGRILAIQAELQPDEVAFLKEVAKDLTPEQLRAWFDELSNVSIPDAVTRIRGLIAGKTGGAS